MTMGAMVTKPVGGAVSPESRGRTPFVVPIILRAAERMGASVLLEPEFGFVGHITFGNGKTTLFRNTNLNINPLGSVEIAKDKGYAAFFLAQFGHPVPVGRAFFSDRLCKHLPHPRNIDDGFRYAQELGLPVIVKPNNRSQGKLVTKVETKADYYRASRAILRNTSVMLVQHYYPLNDFRIVVLDDDVISAYQRLPLSVKSDGKSTVREMLQKKQQEFRKIGRDTVIDDTDFRIALNLRRQRLSLASIPPEGTTIQLLHSANLSTGGDAIDLTDIIHPGYSRLAVRITAEMGLRLCGVDILTRDISVPPTDYIVLEINGSPGLDNYASIGKTQTELVQGLYERILTALERQ